MIKELYESALVAEINEAWSASARAAAAAARAGSGNGVRTSYEQRSANRLASYQRTGLIPTTLQKIQQQVRQNQLVSFASAISQGQFHNTKKYANLERRYALTSKSPSRIKRALRNIKRTNAFEKRVKAGGSEFSTGLGRKG